MFAITGRFKTLYAKNAFLSSPNTSILLLLQRYESYIKLIHLLGTMVNSSLKIIVF